MSPDWIAHGILDSIVDSFFPYLEDVEKEVLRMEDLVFSEDSQINPGNAKSDDACLSPQPVYEDAEKVVCVTPNEKGDQTPRPSKASSIFQLFPGLQKLRKSRSFIYSVLQSMSLTRESKSISTTATLRRLAKIRRLVTSMTRLLATKSEVIAQIRKRLLTQNRSGLVISQSRVEDIDVAIYLGDVQGMYYGLTIIVFLIVHTHTRSHSINTAFVKPLRANAQPITSQVLVSAQHQRRSCQIGQR